MNHLMHLRYDIRLTCCSSLFISIKSTYCNLINLCLSIVYCGRSCRSSFLDLQQEKDGTFIFVSFISNQNLGQKRQWGSVPMQNFKYVCTDLLCAEYFAPKLVKAQLIIVQFRTSDRHAFNFNLTCYSYSSCLQTFHQVMLVEPLHIIKVAIIIILSYI